MKIDDLKTGLELGPTEWLEITQDRIDLFADATDDHQWIHVDPERAKDGPFGTTIAHGDLTMALLAPWSYELLPVDDSRFAVNYGFNKVRFPAPVPVGSRLRTAFRLTEVAEVDGGVHVVVAATVEREGQEKPVCAAELVLRYYR